MCHMSDTHPTTEQQPTHREQMISRYANAPHNDREANAALVEGPTAAGEFFISSRRGDVWDGENWRGFGAARVYRTFMGAWKMLPIARAAMAKRN